MVRASYSTAVLTLVIIAWVWVSLGGCSATADSAMDDLSDLKVAWKKLDPEQRKAFISSLDRVNVDKIEKLFTFSGDECTGVNFGNAILYAKQIELTKGVEISALAADGKRREKAIFLGVDNETEIEMTGPDGKPVKVGDELFGVLSFYKRGSGASPDVFVQMRRTDGHHVHNRAVRVDELRSIRELELNYSQIPLGPMMMETAKHKDIKKEINRLLNHFE